MSKYRNKYRIESARFPGWDYSTPGYYFVTICAYNHECIFGQVRDSRMFLNEYGEIVQQEWEKTFEIRRELKRDEYCVMPNHFHAIVRIVDSNTGPHGQNNQKPTDQNVETHGRASLWETGIHRGTGVAFRSPKSISSLYAGFKSIVTKRINENRKTPAKPVWQQRFHDHIIRNDRELFAIRQYIKNNPRNWENDRNINETDTPDTGKQPWFVYMK
jgi:putative transposase